MVRHADAGARHGRLPGLGVRLLRRRAEDLGFDRPLSMSRCFLVTSFVTKHPPVLTDRYVWATTVHLPRGESLTWSWTENPPPLHYPPLSQLPCVPLPLFRCR